MTPSCANLSVKEAADILARVKVAAEKSAAGLLEGATDYLAANPWARGAVAGAGVGGLLGAARNFMQPREQRDLGGNTLRGALLGGTAGAGIGALLPHLQNLTIDQTPPTISEGGKHYAIRPNATPEDIAHDLVAGSPSGLAAHPLMAGAAAVDVGSMAARRAAEMQTASRGLLGSQGTTMGQLNKGIENTLATRGILGGVVPRSPATKPFPAGSMEELAQYLQRSDEPVRAQAISKAVSNEPWRWVPTGAKARDVQPQEIRNLLGAGGVRQDLAGSLLQLAGKDPMAATGYTGGTPNPGMLARVQRAWGRRNPSLLSKGLRRGLLYGGLGLAESQLLPAFREGLGMAPEYRALEEITPQE